jgi:hypothetical protein
MNSIKEVKDLINENYKSSNKEINEDISRWKDLPYSWIDRIKIVKMTIQPKAINMFMQCPSKF